jgi:hypothetical protein
VSFSPSISPHSASNQNASFASLLREISNVPLARQRRVFPNQHGVCHEYPALAIFRRWSTELHRNYVSLPKSTSDIVFTLLFPEEDVGRKYGMQEKRLARCLADCFGIGKDALTKWCDEGREGCLGAEVCKILDARWTVRSWSLMITLCSMPAIGIGR